MFRSTVALLLGAGCLLLCTPAPAQTTGRLEGTRFAPAPTLDPNSVSSTPYYSVYAYAINGYTPEYYASFARGDLPTYMTSINYPWIYGAYGYMYAPGRFTYGAGQASFTTGPTIYGVFSTPSAMTGVRYVPDTAAAPVVTTAAVDVRLPADAELRFDGVRVGQTGTLRRFMTPALVPGTDYAYDVAASWNEGGREVTRNRRVNLRAGDRVTVDLTTEAPAPTTTELRTGPAQPARP
jgi:uncharacterized protein (TIGR03000 family)